MTLKGDTIEELLKRYILLYNEEVINRIREMRTLCRNLVSLQKEPLLRNRGFFRDILERLLAPFLLSPPKFSMGPNDFQIVDIFALTLGDCTLI